MSRNNPSLLKSFSYLPWWASVLAGISVYVALKFVTPSLESENPIFLAVATVGQNMAWMFASLFLIQTLFC
jgi:restriction system protein